MTTAPPHLVHRVRFDVMVGSQAQGVAIQERLSAFQRARLATLVDECVANALDPSEALVVDRLALDVGDIPADALEREMESRVRRALTAALLRARGPARGRGAAHTPAGGAVSARAAEATPAQRLWRVMTTGRLDGTPPGEGFELDDMVRAALHDSAIPPAALARALLLTPRVRRRVAHQLSRESRRLLLHLLREEREEREAHAPQVPERRGSRRLADEHLPAHAREALAAAPEWPRSPDEWEQWLAAALAPERTSRATGRRTLAPLFGDQPVHLWSGSAAAHERPAAPVFQRTAAERLASHIVRHVSPRW